MEVKIIISDGGSAPGTVDVSGQASAAAPNTPPASSSDAIDAGQAGGGGASSMSAGSGMNSSAPAELLARAAEMGAMNAGPAPDLSLLQQGAPFPFITGQMANLSTGPGMIDSAAPESAGAAPGAEARMVTHTAPEGGGSHS